MAGYESFFSFEEGSFWWRLFRKVLHHGGREYGVEIENASSRLAIAYVEEKKWRANFKKKSIVYGIEDSDYWTNEGTACCYA